MKLSLPEADRQDEIDTQRDDYSMRDSPSDWRHPGGHVTSEK